MFKSVQYYLKKYDINKLCNAYFDKYCSNITDFYYNDLCLKYKKVTFGEYEKKVKKYIKDNIRYLRNVKTKKVKLDENYIFIAHKYMPFFVNDGAENFAFLYKVSEIISNRKSISSYAFELNTYSEMLSFLVADTFYNKEHIEDILVDFLHEATFFGNKEEHDINAKREENILLENEKEIKESKRKSYVKYDRYKFLKKICKYSDKKINEIKKYDNLYKKSDAAKAEYLAQEGIIKYNNLSALHEIKFVKDVLIKRRKIKFKTN